jgi:23S rRNA pseudouridine1911/1915/1917 synthase
MLPFRIVFEDDSILVVEKQAGMVTHPAYRHPDGTLTNAVADWMSTRHRPTPWLLHRLDRDTSGLVLFAKTEAAMHWYARQFAAHLTGKHYIALVWGNDLPPGGMISAALRRDPTNRRRVIVAEDGQAAQTCYMVRERHTQTALVDLWPLTGRTHQLRAHLATLGYPIVGDPIYADGYAMAERLLLHAAALTLRQPHGHSRTMLAPLPQDFIAILCALAPNTAHVPCTPEASASL